MNDFKLLRITIKDKNSTTVEEDITAVTSLNEKGPFDILGLHENFITVIKGKITLHKKDGTKKEINLERGVIKNLQNEVSIYLGI
jgi:F0F1-type ATP synthase epsilon subunit